MHNRADLTTKRRWRALKRLLRHGLTEALNEDDDVLMLLADQFVEADADCRAAWLPMHADVNRAAIAHHEAGHAVIARALGIKILFVRATPVREYSGMCTEGPSRKTP